jgi:CrcB protein
MNKVLFVAVGGAAGAVSRYYVSAWGQRLVGGGFPLGTLLVNLCGCFLMGLLGAAFTGPILVREEYRVAILIGFLGGLTTFSSYSWETLSLLNDGQRIPAMSNLILSNVAALTAVWFGFRLSERWFGV